MAELSQELIDKAINRIMVDWYRALYQKLKSSMEEKGLKLTGDLQASLFGDIEEAAGTTKAALQLYFSDSGRLQDMKYSYKGGKMPPLEAMLKYIDKVGVNKFNMIPGYPVGVRPTNKSKLKGFEDRSISEVRLGFALAKSRVGEGKTWGKRKWYNKKVWGSINELVEILMTKVKEIATDQIKGAFDQ